MAVKMYEVLLEIDDTSNGDGEDIEGILAELFEGYLPEGLPSDLHARVVEINEAE